MISQALIPTTCAAGRNPFLLRWAGLPCCPNPVSVCIVLNSDDLIGLCATHRDEVYAHPVQPELSGVSTNMPRTGGNSDRPTLFVDRNGNPITPAEWYEKFGDTYERRVLAKDTVGKYTIETVWHGTNTDPEERPFGTAVKCEHGKVIEELDQYSTTEEAIVGHRDVLSLVEDGDYAMGCIHDDRPELDVADLGEQP